MITPEQAVNSEAKANFLKEWEHKVDNSLAVYGYIEISRSDYIHIKDLLSKYEENGFELVKVYDAHFTEMGAYRTFRCYLLRIKQEKPVEPVEPEQPKTSWWSRWMK
jgi:hypothetical protein